MAARPQTKNKPELCSYASTALREDPIASVPQWSRCLLIEVKTPWGQDIKESEHFPREVLQAVTRAEQRRVAVRVQGLVRDPEYSVDRFTRVMDVRRPEGSFALHDRDEFVVPDSEVPSLVETLLERPDQLARFERYREDVAGVRDLLVCTHGRRDACCAKFGLGVYQALRQDFAPASKGRLRVWQTSHTGGHRFAANIIDLPEGRYWGRLDVGLAKRLVSPSGQVADFRDCYRGWAGHDSPFVQVAEREAFMREGWGWLDCAQSGRLIQLSEDEDSAEVRIDFTSPDGTVSGAYEATVELVDPVAVPGCLGIGNPVEANQYRLTRFAKVKP